MANDQGQLVIAKENKNITPTLSLSVSDKRKGNNRI